MFSFPFITGSNLMSVNKQQDVSDELYFCFLPSVTLVSSLSVFLFSLPLASLSVVSAVSLSGGLSTKGLLMHT